MVEAAETLHPEASQQWLLAEQAFPTFEAEAWLKCSQYLGHTALNNEVIIQNIETTPNNSTLLARLQSAALGDKVARQAVTPNVATDVAERMFKVADISEVQMQVENGHFMQADRELTDIQRNTFAFTKLNPEMTRRSKAEFKNIFMFESLHGADVLQTHDAVVFEPCPTDIQTQKDYRFFMDTESCSIQLISAEGNNVTLQTAMVAGKKTRDSPRHDIAAIHSLAADNGVELFVENESDMVQYVMLVPKSQVPHGVSDIVKCYDQAVGGTFYGQAKPVQDYLQHAEMCKKRHEDYAGIVEKITNQLISEAHAFETPMDAVERLDYLSGRECVGHAVLKDQTVNAAIFGPESAAHIEAARIHQANGDTDAAQASLNKAKATENSSSCPLFKDGSSNGEEGPDKEKSEKKWMKCPHCTARVYDDPCAKILSCWDCRALVVNRTVVSKGNGGSKKRQMEQKAKHEAYLKKKELEMTKQVDEVFKDIPVPPPLGAPQPNVKIAEGVLSAV